MARVGQAAKVPPPLAEELSGVVLSGETLAEHRACTSCRAGRAWGVHTYRSGRVYGQQLEHHSDTAHARQAPAQNHKPSMQRRHQRTCLHLPAQRLLQGRAAWQKDMSWMGRLHLPRPGMSAPPKVSTLPLCCLPGQADSLQNHVFTWSTACDTQRPSERSLCLASCRSGGRASSSL